MYKDIIKNTVRQKGTHRRQWKAILAILEEKNRLKRKEKVLKV